MCHIIEDCPVLSALYFLFIYNETILITHVIIHCLSPFIMRKNVALTFLFYLKVYLLLFLETSPGFPLLSSHCHCCQNNAAISPLTSETIQVKLVNINTYID